MVNEATYLLLTNNMLHFLREINFKLCEMGNPDFFSWNRLLLQFCKFYSFLREINSGFACETQCGNYGNSLSRIFAKSFVKLTVLLNINKVLKSWFDEIFLCKKEIIVFPHCVRYTLWKNEKFSLTKKIFREINSLVTSFVNPQ